MLMYIPMAPYVISLISGVRLRLAISVTQEYKVLFFTFSTQQPDLCRSLTDQIVSNVPQMP